MERAGVDCAKRIVELEAQRDQLKEENVKLRAREVRLKERFDSDESKWREEEDEIRAKCWLAESEKRKLQIDLKVAVERVAEGGISDKLKAAEAEAARLDISLKDSRSRLVSEFKRAMEAEKQVSELLLKIELLDKANDKQELVELTQSIKFLEDALCEANKSKTEDIKRILNEKMDVEAKSGKKVSEMARRIEVLIMEKRSMTEEMERILKRAQEKYEKTNSRLVLRVEVLEREKLGLEMETRKKDQEIKLLVQKLNDSSAATKKISEMETNRCTVPIPQRVHPVAHNQGFTMKGGKQEAGAMPAYSKLSVKKGGRIAGKDPNRPKRPPSAFFVFMEEFRKTFKEKNPNNKSIIAVGKAGGAEWKTMSVADKAPYVEKAVQRKKEYEKSWIAYNKKLVKTHCGVDSDNIRRVEGGGTMEEESDKSGSEVHDDDDDDEEGSDEDDDDLQLSGDKRRVSGSENQRRKVEALGCTVASQAGTKRSKQGLVWTTPEKMLNAFTANDELCMRSVCALYRKHKSLGPWKNRSTSSIGNNGFKPPYEARGMALGELLTSRDPEGRLKKSLAEFERADSRGPADCMQIARQHYKELFEIYRNSLDPLYRPGDDMN